MTAYLSFLNTQLATPLTGYTLKAMLVNGYAQSQSDNLAAVTAFEVSGTGYTAGGIAVTGLAVIEDDPLGTIAVTFDPLNYGAIDVSAITGVVLYRPSGSSLVAADTFAVVDAAASTSFVYTPHADGFLLMSAEMP